LAHKNWPVQGRIIQSSVVTNPLLSPTSLHPIFRSLFRVSASQVSNFDPFMPGIGALGQEESEKASEARCHDQPVCAVV